MEANGIREEEKEGHTLLNHTKILLLARTRPRLPPIYLQPLASMQLDDLLQENIDNGLMCGGSEAGDGVQFGHGDEHGVGGGVDGVREPEDAVRDGLAAPEFGVVFDVVEPVGVGVSEPFS